MHNARSSSIWLLAAGLLAILTASCALVGGTEEHLRHAKGYTVEAPTDWKARDPNDGDAAFRLPSGATVTLVSSCGRSHTAPLDVLARQLLFGLHDINVAERGKRAFGPNEGLFTQAHGTFSGTTMYLALFTTVHQSCVFDFSMINPRPITPAEEKEFFAYLSSFRYGRD